MTDTDYPTLAALMGGWFHQDFDIEGSTVSEVLKSFNLVTPAAERVRLEAEITRFLAAHPDDLDASFDATFQPDVIPSVLAGSTRAFLEKVRDSLG
jgi:hypothetical protein